MSCHYYFFFQACYFSTIQSISKCIIYYHHMHNYSRFGLKYCNLPQPLQKTTHTSLSMTSREILRFFGESVSWPHWKKIVNETIQYSHVLYRWSIYGSIAVRMTACKAYAEVIFWKHFTPVVLLTTSLLNRWDFVFFLPVKALVTLERRQCTCTSITFVVMLTWGLKHWYLMLNCKRHSPLALLYLLHLSLT